MPVLDEGKIVGVIDEWDMLQAVVGSRQAAELMYTGKDITADEALQMGLVGRVYADADTLHKVAAAWCRRRRQSRASPHAR